MALSQNTAPFSVDHLKPDRPMLLATVQDFHDLKDSGKSPELVTFLDFLKANGEAMLEVEPVRFEKEGIRLLEQSRRALKRISTWALLYRAWEDDRFLHRTIRELEAIIAFPDWNPVHFLDTAEMTLAVAIGIDWLWDDLSPDLRTRAIRAVLEKGIRPSLDESAEENWWIDAENNWNPVCHAGMIAGAILIAGEEPGIAEDVINRALKHLPKAMDETDPDGIYPEGPMYWQYGTAFTAILIELLENATGRHYGLPDHDSFRRSIIFRVMTVAPSGRFFNFHDSGTGKTSLSAVVSWFAKRFNNPLAHYEHDRLLGEFLDDPKRDPSNGKGRLMAFQALWFPENPDNDEPGFQHLPTVWYGGRPNALSIVRSGWEPDAFYFAVKGGQAWINHAHMDAGSFVFEDKGVRWAVDLGRQKYNSLETHRLGIWDRRRLSDRWRVFRLGPHSHNLLLIDEQLHDVHGIASIQMNENKPGIVETVVDLSDVYRRQVDSYHRKIEIHDRKLIRITEEIRGARKRENFAAIDAATLHWRMVTEADIRINGNEAVLSQDGQQLFVKVLAPDRFTLRAEPLDPPPYFWDEPNPGKYALDIWTRADLDGSQSMTILMSTNEAAIRGLSR